jgi:hypothetical protein
MKYAKKNLIILICTGITLHNIQIWAMKHLMYLNVGIEISIYSF